MGVELSVPHFCNDHSYPSSFLGCVSAWILKHGDRRKGEFEAAVADHNRRRMEAQVSVVERQVLLAKKLRLPLVVQLPPQDDAERHMAEILLTNLSGEDLKHHI